MVSRWVVIFDSLIFSMDVQAGFAYLYVHLTMPLFPDECSSPSHLYKSATNKAMYFLENLFIFNKLECFLSNYV